MKIISKMVIITILLFLSNQLFAQNTSLALVSLEEHLENLMNWEAKGGELLCVSEKSKERIKYKSCEQFLNLQEQRCYGDSTLWMSRSLGYRKLCKEMKILRNGQTVTTNFFDLNSSDWWKSLPAEIIPLSAGIYSERTLEAEKSKLEKMVNGKLLKDIKTPKQSVKNGVITLILNIEERDLCGEVHDVFEFSPVLLADFDNDGVAELLIKGSRMNTSKTCHLGSGNYLGASFSVLLKKTKSMEVPTILP